MKDYIFRNIIKKHNKHYTYEYTDKRGNIIPKKDYLKYIKKIYIAPAYDNVKINKNNNGKILAIGVDEKGRKVEEVAAEWIANNKNIWKNWMN